MLFATKNQFGQSFFLANLLDKNFLSGNFRDIPSKILFKKNKNPSAVRNRRVDK